MTLKQSTDLFLNNVSIRLKPDTYQFYSKYLEFVNQHLGNLDIQALNKHHVNQLLMIKKEENPEISNATLNKIITCIKVMYRFVTEEKLIIPKLKEKQKPIPIVQEDIIQKIFAYYKTQLHHKIQFRNYLYYKLSLETGLRLNEILNIKMNNINMIERLIYITVTKTDVNRYVSFSKETQLLLQKFILLYYENQEYLFINFKTGKRLSKPSIQSQTETLKRKLNIKGSISPHKWRHTFATNFIQRGGNLTYLQTFLGHADLTTTQKYLHLTTKDLQKEYDRIFNNDAN
jgi:site-specific recombinase XerD